MQYSTQRAGIQAWKRSWDAEPTLRLREREFAIYVAIDPSDSFPAKPFSIAEAGLPESGPVLSIVDDAGKHRIAPGAVDIWVGGGQPVARFGLPKPSGAQTKFTITSGVELPD